MPDRKGAMTQKYSDTEYLNTELFCDRDTDIRCLTRKIVLTSSAHRCAFADVLGRPHQIEPRTRAIREKAIVEGQWGTNYSCLPCIDIWLDEIRGNQ
jgi:hypothetical protein